MNNIEQTWYRIQESSYGDTDCFLCGTKLTSINRSVEHVIPKWAQKKFNLWDQRINLLNGTSIQYKRITIPCCKNCNNHFLKAIETKVSRAVVKGIDAVKSLDKRILFLWLGKIFYGLMYKELFLSNNRKEEFSETILTPEVMDEYRMHYIFLQSYRELVKFNNFFPSTILIVETQKSADILKCWDINDNLNHMYISVRMGGIGIIGILQDCELLKEFPKLYPQFFQIPLHPIQFRELQVIILYQISLMNRTPKFILGEKEGILNIHLLPLAGLSNKPIFDNWIETEFATLLSAFMGVPQEIVNPEAGLIWTSMLNDDGTPLFLDINKEFFT